MARATGVNRKNQEQSILDNSHGQRDIVKEFGLQIRGNCKVGETGED